MASETAPKNSKALLWTGRVISALPVLLMAMGIVTSVINPAQIVDGMKKYGYPPEAAQPIIIIEAVCVLLYAIPQTSILGAILLTGYLGGATATHVRVGEYAMAPIPVIVGILVWLGLLLREPRLRALLPWRCLRGSCCSNDTPA
jgi:hypothetical protein